MKSNRQSEHSLSNLVGVSMVATWRHLNEDVVSGIHTTDVRSMSVDARRSRKDSDEHAWGNR